MDSNSSSNDLMVSVVGDGNLDPTSNQYQFAENFGHLLIDEGFRLVTGGLGGVMEAASKGARRSSNFRPGSIISILPGMDAIAGNTYSDVVIPTGLGHFRNAIVAQSSAVVAIGGGAGTLSEMAFAWMFNRLLIAFRGPGWSGRLADSRLDDRLRFASFPEDQIFGVDTPDEAIRTLANWLPVYQELKPMKQ